MKKNKKGSLSYETGYITRPLRSTSSLLDG